MIRSTVSIGGVDISVDKISYSGGAPRFYYRTSLTGKTIAVKQGYDPLKVSMSFLIKRSEKSKIDTLRALRRSGSLVEVVIDDEANTAVISSLRYDDDGEFIQGSIELTLVDEIADDGGD